MKCLIRLSATALSMMALLYSNGCASILSKSTYAVDLNSQPAGAQVEVMDENGEVVYTGTTPTSVELCARKGYFKGKDYTVRFTKPGFEAMSVDVRRGVDMWYVAGNFVFGGLLGWLVVDPATGAMWKLEHVNTTMRPAGQAMSEDAALRIATLDQIPQSLRSHLVPLR